MPFKKAHNFGDETRLRSNVAVVGIIRKSNFCFIFQHSVALFEG